MQKYDLVVIGGGPAGLAAAITAYEKGIRSIVILERDNELGGILNQCIHSGFGLQSFRQELTGPEFASRYIKRIKESGIDYRLNTTVLKIEEKIVTVINMQEGLFKIAAEAIILAMGCREKPRGYLGIPGYRPSGIFTAGTAQKMINIYGYLPGKEVVILGSGDIGLIMARRLTLEGAVVRVVAEILPYAAGLKRNLVQCLEDYGIPLMLSHTVTDIKGKERVEGVTLAQVDQEKRVIQGTEKYYACDTLLLSCGLVPENELSRKAGLIINPITLGPSVNESMETSKEGIFACGNVLHVHDLADSVVKEAALAGTGAAEYIKKGKSRETQKKIRVCPGEGIRYVVPETINMGRAADFLEIRLRVRKEQEKCFIRVYSAGERIFEQRKEMVSPGKMEEVTIAKEMLSSCGGMRTLEIRLEE